VSGSSESGNALAEGVFKQSVVEAAHMPRSKSDERNRPERSDPASRREADRFVCGVSGPGRMEIMKVPSWAILPAAGKLVSSSFRHPNKQKAIIVEPDAHRVSLSVDESSGKKEQAPTAEPATHG
jgi:hypothetical protein